ncbi:hypothetical protein ASG51_02750 [Methylobacterium sp. Leaf465]|uniref:hypothetical protein n=1 Tax=Methylobacterium sp. Leaf465 TaxID=1736385 RepID=UPI0006F5FAA6|nr:hypothetical protein [Methylobacterium sp. Leaf465]KQT84995.1 hypothetical protein ASG51_02750 [Methylobacterium sp. Leaf465]
MVTVHHFRVWDVAKDEWVYPPLKSPEDRIRDVAKGEVIPGTAEEVESSQLDEHGRYDPSKSQTT